MLTNFPGGITSFGVPVLGNVSGLPFTGNYWFVNPANGADGNDGTPELPLATLYEAHRRCIDGNNDVVILIGDGTNTGTARLSTALAQASDSTATAGTLVWSKSATHLVGVAAPTMIGQRARIAPPTGTYTGGPSGTFGSATFVSVTATGCYFANLDVYVGFSTGYNGMLGWVDSGGRNAYSNVNFQGMNDAASAQGANSRTLKITGSTGENTFYNCVIGGDTTTRTAANASLEFAGGTPRNIFKGCVFPFQGSAAGVLGILGTGASCMDRFQLFQDCMFINNIKSTSTAMTVLASLTNASPGGLFLFKNPTLVGITDFGDTNALANSYVDGGAPTAATTGIAVNPT